MKKIITVAKILGLLFFNYFIFSINNPWVTTGIVVLFILACLPAYSSFIKRLQAVLPVSLMIILFQIIFNDSISLNSRILLGYLAAIRLVAISLSVLLFLTITSMSELVQFFSFLPRKAVLIITMTCYFIPGILNESEKIKAVQKSRGMNSNNLYFITNLASIIIPLIHRVFQRAEILSMNLLTRGYKE